MSRAQFSIYSSLDDCPKELLDELNISESGLIVTRVVDLFKKAGGVLNINEILIGYYREYKVVFQKTKMLQVIFKLRDRKKILLPTGVRGEYKLIDSLL